MLPLLTNTDIRIHPRCQRTTVVWAAISGPHLPACKWDLDTVMSYILGVTITLALVTVCLDITIWRP